VPAADAGALLFCINASNHTKSNDKKNQPAGIMTEISSAKASSPRLRVIFAACIGSALEWYDFFLYGTASALVFGELFFPKGDPLVGTMLAFLTFGVGFVVRPLGGILFGVLGDRFGRKPVLVATLLMIGIGTRRSACCRPSPRSAIGRRFYWS
jgi:hypothetical protein